MKQRLQTSLGQQLVLTPQLRQALHLLQLSALDLEAEVSAAVESNPLLEWKEDAAQTGDSTPEADIPAPSDDSPTDTRNEDWGGGESWQGSGTGGSFDDDSDSTDRAADPDTLREHLSWQLNLSQLSPHDRLIGEAIIDAIEDDGYLRCGFDDIVAALGPEATCSHEEIQAVLCRIQHMDPIGVGARDLRECLLLQLAVLDLATPGHELAVRIVDELLEKLPRLGEDRLAESLGCGRDEADVALQLLRSLDPHPGSCIGALPQDTYVAPDCIISRHEGVWKVSLVDGPANRVTIHRGYQGMIGQTSEADGTYLRGRLQEARWLLRNLQQRGETLLKVTNCLVRQQSGFLEFGPQALRPLTLREVAAEIGVHESTVSRAVAGKFAHTPRGTLPLRDFFASGVSTDTGGQASSTAIQQMILGLVEAENPGKPLSDARLTEALKAEGVMVARRTVSKYREALSIPSSHERVRLG
ncbi:RNA polymerase factor sigma-54 [Luteimonas qiangzhengi]|uniref:RNA polymerase factor sigma-54 n=1 Tax=Luteimonas sp. MJ146 TaxID=3129240 RepID=UPI0031BA96D4